LVKSARNPPEIGSPPEILPDDFQIRQNFANLAEKTAIWQRCSCASWASWAESCSGKPGQTMPLGKLGRKIITNGFRSTRLLKQKRFEKISCQANWGQRATQASQASCATVQAGLQNQNKQFLLA
jgi:hypothetical protein